jgi:hypothetical protein
MPDLTILYLNIVFRSTLFKRDNEILITDYGHDINHNVDVSILHKHTSVLAISISDNSYYVTRLTSQTRVTQLQL